MMSTVQSQMDGDETLSKKYGWKSDLFEAPNQSFKEFNKA
jgi:hypothetical protein